MQLEHGLDAVGVTLVAARQVPDQRPALERGNTAWSRCAICTLVSTLPKRVSSYAGRLPDKSSQIDIAAVPITRSAIC